MKKKILKFLLILVIILIISYVLYLIYDYAVECAIVRIKKAVDEVYLTEAPRLNRYLNLILMIANLATLLGLLGTVYGLIKCFDAVANLPAAERPQALADGIAVTMTATFFGLFVAIPSIFSHGLLSSQSERLTEELEEKAVKVMNLL